MLVIGTDVWADGAEEAALRLVERLGLPAITNGMGRGVIPGGHPMLMTKARGLALGQCDLTIVVGTPLDFRLGYGVVRRQGRGATGRASCTWPTAETGIAGHADLAASAHGDLTLVLDGIHIAFEQQPRKPDWSCVGRRLQDAVKAATERDTPLLSARGRPDPPGAHLRRAAAAAGRRCGRDRRRRRLRLLRRQVRRAVAPGSAGSTLAPTAASAPGSAQRSARASPGRRPRSCCCSATAPPACR